MIGPEARVEDEVTVVGPTVVGAGSICAQGSVIARSVLWDCCRVLKDARVDRSLLASGARVAAGRSLYGAVLVGHTEQVPLVEAPSVQEAAETRVSAVPVSMGVGAGG
jgi:NDP-sugar pyrophosphorylase family protein